MTTLTPQQVDGFRERGFHTPVRVLEADEAREIRARIEKVSDSTHPLHSGDLHLLYPWMWELVHDERIVAPVRQLLGDDLLLWGQSLIVKEPGDERFYSYHQDATYWGLEPYDVVTAWIALSDASLIAGPMRFVPGSHREILEHHNTYGERNMLSRGQTIEGVSDADTVPAPLQLGEMSLHHVALIHGSGPNRGADRRMGLVLRYTAAHVRPVRGHDSAVLISGEPEHDDFTLWPEPKMEAGHEERERRKRAADWKLKILVPEQYEEAQAKLAEL